MIPRAFDYFDPASIPEAVDLLGKYGDDAKLLAGGQSLLPLMKIRLASPKIVVDLWRIPDLAYIREENGAIVIGAMTTHYMLQTSNELQTKLPILAQAAGVVGDPLVRNLGTIGGSAAHAAPNADYPAVLVALDAVFNLTGPAATRKVSAADFFKDSFTTALDPAEILAEVRISIPPDDRAGVYLKLSRRGTDFAVVSAAVILRKDENGRCADARVVLGGVGTVPVRAKAAEDLLNGESLTPDLINRAAKAAAQGLEPPSDVHGDSQYRIDVSKVYVRRAVEAAWRHIS
ncbi:MAG: xanthine dehydrogenase family protein subunit M [Deltaproteobacteria bacterium]|nr:xanthine dehydrogenase family protein subunit M [Deltaproteobacteria bacterium]